MTTVPLEAATALERARALREELAQTAAEIDRAGVLPVEGLELVARAGFGRLLLPPEYGGCASRAAVAADLELLVEILTELSAGESSTAQICFVHFAAVRGLYGGLFDVAEETKRKLAGLVLEGGRIGNAAAEAGKTPRDYRTHGRRVDGGIELTGHKLFSTGAEGSDYVFVPFLLEGHESVQEGGLSVVLVPPDAPGLTLNDDWDNMGQRATSSGSMRFDGVFVPERYHSPVAGGAERFFTDENIWGPTMQMCLNGVILGMGLGAFAELLPHVREFARPSSPGVERAADEPLVRWHVGRISTALAAARALQREAARAVEAAEGEPSLRAEASVQMMRARHATYEAVLAATGELHRLTGARSTAARYDLDRFWRNARTLTVHDSIDLKLQHIGAFELDRTPPPPGFVS